MTKKAEEKANNDCALRIYYEAWMLHKQGQKKVQEKNQNAAEMKLFCSNNGKSEFLRVFPHFVFVSGINVEKLLPFCRVIRKITANKRFFDKKFSTLPTPASVENRTFKTEKV